MTTFLNDNDKMKKTNREMQRLSGFFNPEASKAVEKTGTVEEPTNAPTLLQNGLEAAVEGDESGKDVTSIAINHLFGDLAFLCRDSFLKEPDIALYSDSTEYKNLKSKLSQLHILDGLDYLNDEKNIMKEDTRSGLLREYGWREHDEVGGKNDSAGKTNSCNKVGGRWCV